MNSLEKAASPVKLERSVMFMIPFLVFLTLIKSAKLTSSRQITIVVSKIILEVGKKGFAMVFDMISLKEKNIGIRESMTNAVKNSDFLNYMVLWIIISQT